MNDKAKELSFQNDMIKQLVANGWLLGSPDKYNRELALYSEDLLAYVKETQDEQWQKYLKLYPPTVSNEKRPEQKFLERVASQLKKTGHMKKTGQVALLMFKRKINAQYGLVNNQTDPLPSPANLWQYYRIGRQANGWKLKKENKNDQNIRPTQSME